MLAELHTIPQPLKPRLPYLHAHVLSQCAYAPAYLIACCHACPAMRSYVHASSSCYEILLIMCTPSRPMHLSARAYDLHIPYRTSPLPNSCIFLACIYSCQKFSMHLCQVCTCTPLVRSTKHQIRFMMLSCGKAPVMHLQIRGSHGKGTSPCQSMKSLSEGLTTYFDRLS